MTTKVYLGAVNLQQLKIECKSLSSLYCPKASAGSAEIISTIDLS